MLNAKKKDLLGDIEKAVEFDQSNLFKSIYEAEYGVLGGTPYGLLVADYEFDRSADDLTVLRGLSNIAAASHAPLVSNAAPKLFSMNRFSELSNPRDLAKVFDTPEYAGWQSFRESEDSRYTALCMPRVLGRLPYGGRVQAGRPSSTTRRAWTARTTTSTCGWAPPGPTPQRVTSAFKADGWFSRTRGVEGGGKVEGLPVSTFKTDQGDVAMKCPTEVAITDRREFELSNLGIPAAHPRQGQGLRRVHRHPVVPEGQEVLRRRGQLERRAVVQAEPHSEHLTLCPLPEGDGPQLAGQADGAGRVCRTFSTCGSKTMCWTTRAYGRRPAEGRAAPAKRPASR